MHLCTKNFYKVYQQFLEKIKDYIKSENEKETKITGNKMGVLNGLDGMLNEAEKYEIIIRKVK